MSAKDVAAMFEVSEIDEIESRLQFAISAMNAAADVHKQTEVALKEATLSVSELGRALVEAKEARDRALPQCKIVRRGRWRDGEPLEACIVGVTNGGMLRVRVNGADGIELYAWDQLMGEYHARSRQFPGYLRDAPPEFMPESAK